jgi:AcrR family transcriptional regulator
MQNSVEKTEVRKQQIRNAALRCFSLYGFSKTTMDDIASTIGMKKASLYYYYKNKEAIFCEMIETEVHHFIDTATEKISSLKLATEKLYALVKLENDYFKEKVGTFDLSVSTIVEAQPVIVNITERARNKDIGLLKKIIEEGIENGEFRACNAKKVAETIRTVLDSIKFREFQMTKVLVASDINYNKIKKAGLEMLELIIHGLKKYK